MFLDDKQEWRSFPPPEPRKPNNALTDREEKLVLWVGVVFAAVIFIAPIGGASIVQALLAAFFG